MEQTPKPTTSNLMMFNVLPVKAIALMVLQIAVDIGVLVAGAVVLGRYLDMLMDTKPWITVAMAVVSSVAACFVTYQIGMRAVDRTNREVPLQKPTLDKSTEPIQEAKP